MKRNMWASFWANFRPSMRRCGAGAKLRFLNSSIKSLGQFRWSRWPYQKTYAKTLDRIQSHMVSLLFPFVAIPGEAPSDYFRRKSINAGRFASSSGRWSTSWATSVRKWHAHIIRCHDPKTWAKSIYEHHDSAWLAKKRRLASHRHDVSRTKTRSVRGNVAEGLEEARAVAVTPIAHLDIVQEFSI